MKPTLSLFQNAAQRFKDQRQVVHCQVQPFKAGLGKGGGGSEGVFSIVGHNRRSKVILDVMIELR